MPAKGECGNLVAQLRGYAIQLVPCEPTVATTFLCVVASLCGRHVSFANCVWAVVAAEGSLWDPAGVSPDGRSLPVRFPVLAVVHHLHRDAVDDLPLFERAGVWIFHEEVYVPVMVDELQHLAD